MIHHIRQCLRPECRFRFPITDQPGFVNCPRCGSPTRLIESPYQSMKVREGGTPAYLLEGLLDNIRSAMNVGAMFRSADGAGLNHMHLCGVTPTPGHPKVGKTALGAEFAVGWTQHNSSVDAARKIRINGKSLWALEGGSRSQLINNVLHDLPAGGLVVVVGNEVSGVDPGIMEVCDRIVSIPMMGVKESLNVAVAFGIAIYLIRFGFGKP